MGALYRGLGPRSVAQEATPAAPHATPAPPQPRPERYSRTPGPRG